VEAVREQAKKGYDFLVVGVEPAIQDGKFSDRVARAVKGFDGPFALVIARRTLREDPERSCREILVPVTGTPCSRHGAEVALVLAHAMNASITALYVTGRSEDVTGQSEDRDTRLGAGWEDSVEDAILREIVDLGKQHGVTVRPVLRRHVKPGREILRQMNRGAYDLIVLGVSNRPGERLFFGDVADAVVEESKLSIVLVSS
jgi:nucleotide-binding universal stress UspA family protein